MKKYIVLFIIFLIVLFLFTACHNKEIRDMRMKNFFVQDFIADDSQELSIILTKEYSLQELKDFFGEVASNENLAFGGNIVGTDLTMSDVHRKFPIECLRQNGYSVYKVREGGYFYVFWIKSFNPDSAELYDTSDKVTVYFTTHIVTLKNAGDFANLKEGVSTAEDVFQIDSAFELIFLLSNGTSSYSLLDDGTVMEVCYTWNDNVNARDDLIMVSKKAIVKENCSSCLTSILPMDLP